MLQRNQLKTVFGGAEGETVICRCENRDTGAAWFTGSLTDCSFCGGWCSANVPTGSTYTIMICFGPLAQEED